MRARIVRLNPLPFITPLALRPFLFGEQPGLDDLALLVGHRPRLQAAGCPPESLFHLCSPFLEELFDELKTDIVMVFGKGAWGWVNWALVHDRAVWTQPVEPIHARGALCGFSLHTAAAGFSVAKASEALRQLIDGARSHNPT